MGMIAEFERSLLLERQPEGIAIANQAGDYSGESRRSQLPAQATEVTGRVTNGESGAALTRECRVSQATIYNARLRADEKAL